jgi:hypothetical protein
MTYQIITTESDFHIMVKDSGVSYTIICHTIGEVTDWLHILKGGQNG